MWILTWYFPSTLVRYLVSPLCITVLTRIYPEVCHRLHLNATTSALLASSAPSTPCAVGLERAKHAESDEQVGVVGLERAEHAQRTEHA
eukprot:SAG11_NODE_1668_length_4494_cov_1.724460_4_plen_89_part_00